MSDLAALARLLQLASPSLPVGAYSYSQGLEAAVESGIVRDADGAKRWIGDVLALTIATMEAPLVLRLVAAWSAGDIAAARRWNDEFLASRDTAELRAETLQMGFSLRGLAVAMKIGDSAALGEFEELAFPAAFAFVAAAWGLGAREALAGYLFSWIENQVLAALKAVPLGQTEAQRLLRELGESIGAYVDRAAVLGDDELLNFAPGLSLASSRHETQYSRIFRS